MEDVKLNDKLLEEIAKIIIEEMKKELSTDQSRSS